MNDRCFTRVLQGHIALDLAIFPKGTTGLSVCVSVCVNILISEHTEGGGTCTHSSLFIYLFIYLMMMMIRSAAGHSGAFASLERRLGLSPRHRPRCWSVFECPRGTPAHLPPRNSHKDSLNARNDHHRW